VVELIQLMTLIVSSCPRQIIEHFWLDFSDHSEA